MMREEMNVNTRGCAHSVRACETTARYNVCTAVTGPNMHYIRGRTSRPESAAVRDTSEVQPRDGDGAASAASRGWRQWL